MAQSNIRRNHRTVVDTAVVTAWTNKSTLKLHGVILYGKESNMAIMPIMHGVFGEITLIGAN